MTTLQQVRPPEYLQPGPLTRRILVVEDDVDVAAMVASALQREGFAVGCAASRSAGLDWIGRHGLPDLAIVDVQLPGANGLEFCRTVQRSADLPVMILTGISESAFKAEAIRSCAEDYIVKPFHIEELMARVHRVLRRTARVDANSVLTDIGGGIAVDFFTRSATRNGQTIELTPSESKLLHVLVAHEGTTLTFRYLEQRLWPEDGACEPALRVYISRLRRKLRLLNAEAEPLRTERGAGYRFVRATG